MSIIKKRQILPVVLRVISAVQDSASLTGSVLYDHPLNSHFERVYTLSFKNFATLAAPLYAATSGGGHQFTWSDECVQAFSKLKYSLGRTLTLAHPMPHQTFFWIAMRATTQSKQHCLRWTKTDMRNQSLLAQGKWTNMK